MKYSWNQHVVPFVVASIKDLLNIAQFNLRFRQEFIKSPDLKTIYIPAYKGAAIKEQQMKRTIGLR
ncbi:CLUMA_CG009780, isoform A [Clunio marinus]|uniref:CLUMA_CG009780, isoform A n=1 Tax=Clunio marinus TaxID=568069 RepID=A0A1J1I835_9DIPT|nr:CLUMA_CG009780, isoform A [Clunio marinus]